MPHIVPDTVEMVSSDVHNTSTTEDDDIAGNSVDDDTMSTDSNVEHEEEHKARAIGQNLQRPGGSQYNMNDMPIAPQVSSFKSRRLSRRVSQHDNDIFPSFNYSTPSPMSYPRQSSCPMTPNSSTQHEANYSMPTLKLARKKRVNDMEWFVAPKLEFEPLPFSAPMPKAA